MLNIDDVTPRHNLLVVKKYERPEKIGSIYLSPAWRTDQSRALWELVKVGLCRRDPECGCPKCYFGMRLKPPCILVTMPNRGYHFHTEDGVEFYFLAVAEISQIHPYEEQSSDDSNEAA